MTLAYERDTSQLRSMRKISRHVIAATYIGCSFAQAVPPPTPHLTRESREGLLTRLDEVEFPEIDKNSILIAIVGALGSLVRYNFYLHDSPYAHLPTIEARSTPAPELLGCAEVILTASYAPPSKPIGVRLKGFTV
ncbi:hypothetical protein [Variovorax paradoxus]|uniref:hypothetical protein n=1 Tax=Variovorax paradoxus TaxID=34073 RepID=UPI003D65994C